LDPRDKIINEVAKLVCEHITRKVILKLQRMEPCGFSDLKNVWNEICVQTQTEQFITWDLYDETVKGFVYGFIEKLKNDEQVAILLQTDAGFDWQGQQMENAGNEDVSMLTDDKEEHVPLCIDDIVDYVTGEYVYMQAGTWSNSSIRNFDN
jgi:hypothetical protein